MPWRKWNVIVVLILANYVVFGLFAAFVFPVKTQAPLIHTALPTFTPGTKPAQRVGTLTYDFLTPSPSVRATNTSTRTPIAPTTTLTDTTTTPTPIGATSEPTIAPTTAPTTASLATSAPSPTLGLTTGTGVLAPRPLITATSTRAP